jgi:hypothetical protein
MGSVTQVEELEREIRRRLSDADISVDPPAAADASWWVDVERDGRTASVEWRPSRGFGVAAPGGSYGEGVDRVLSDAGTAADYIARALRPTEPTYEALDYQINSILTAIQGAKAHLMQLPPRLRDETTLVADDVSRAERELLRVAESLQRRDSSPLE